MKVLKRVLMSFEEYSGCFHDGGIDSIKHENKTVELEIESCEIHPEWGITEFELTDDRRIKGRLIFSDVKNILIHNEFSSNINRKGNGEILDLIIDNNKLDLGVIWSTYSNGGRSDIFEYIVFEFKDINWINFNKQ